MADTFPAARPQLLPDITAVDDSYLASRAALVRFDRALLRREISTVALSTLKVGGTVHVSVADRFGNVVALTQTLGWTFGAGAATPGFGFAYNNLLDGFDFKDRSAWCFLKPLQAPMTTMAPTIVLKNGTPLLVLGSAGSAHITPAIVAVAVGVIDQQLPLCEAIGRPRALWGGNADEQVYLEIADPISDAQAVELAARGFAAQTLLRFPSTTMDLTDFGAVNAIFIDPADGTMVAAGDPRRQGVAGAADEAVGAAPPLALPGCWRELYALPAVPAPALPAH